MNQGRKSCSQSLRHFTTSPQPPQDAKNIIYHLTCRRDVWIVAEGKYSYSVKGGTSTPDLRFSHRWYNQLYHFPQCSSLQNMLIVSMVPFGQKNVRHLNSCITCPKSCNELFMSTLCIMGFTATIKEGMLIGVVGRLLWVKSHTT